MSLKSGVQDGLTLDQEIGGLSQKNHGGGHQAQTGVVVLVVVPAEEGLAKPTGVFDGAEAVREARAIFQGGELTFRIRIVVGNMGRECVLVTPRSAMSKATGLDFIDEPRSTWVVNWPGMMSCLRQE